jgi:hypothetical protein
VLTKLRAILKLILALLLIVSALIIVPPRVWVKNKTAKVIYNGQLSEKIKLFHGNHGRVLFYIDGVDPNRAYVYTAEDPQGSNGLWRCGSGFFAPLKFFAFSKSRSSGCNGTGIGELLPAKVGNQSIQFTLHDRPVVVSWQAAPR